MERLVAIMVALLLAGCAEAPSDDAEPVGVIEDPADIEASRNGSHIHDYWRGQERLVLLEADDGCASCTVSYGGDHGAVLGSFRPEPDHVVPLGTAWVHATATWNIGEGDHKDVALYVKTANTSEPAFLAVLEPGVPLTFNSTNDDNDPPHHRLSLWEFEVRARPSGGDGTTISDFEVHLKVEVERGLEIPVFPAHPDHWGGASELLLHEATRTVDRQFESPTFSMCAGCLGNHAPDDGAIVPPDAAEVQVVLEATGLPPTLALMVHGADTWTHVSVQPDEEDPQRLVWHLPVDGRPDSPYAKQSLWDLYLVNDQPTPVKYWQGTYQISVKAIKA